MTRPFDPARSVDEVLELYGRFGSECYDEELSQVDHALQTAALAAADGAADALVAAALLHDIGHLLDLASRAPGSAGPGGVDEDPNLDLDHESVGARYLSSLFGPEVTGPVALHVRAKRYRCAIDPAYLEGLSDGSRRSLVRQGGPYDAAGAARFEANAGAADAVALRGWDDGGKVEGLAVPGMDHYRPTLVRLAASR